MKLTRKLCSVLILCLLTSAFAEEKTEISLTEGQKQWLDEVHWILSDYERKAFLSLSEPADRDRFIEAFWTDRDPTPGTVKNEFRDEHYARLEYANREFGRESSLPGWKTDRGRIYILFGKPRFITRNPGGFELQPIEFWHYTSGLGYGLPSSIYLLFYQKNGVGAYRLYSPLNDGIQALFKPQPSFFLKTDEDLYDYLYDRIDKQIAYAALSYIPLDRGSFETTGTAMASVETEVILGTIADARNYQASRRKYVEDILHDRPTVKTYYSLGSEGITNGFYWFQAPNGMLYLNYAVEFRPDRLEMGRYEDEYYTSLTVDGQITTEKKLLVESLSGTHEVKLNQTQFAKVSTQSFQFQGIKPILPGNYGITLILSNNVSGHSITFTGNLEVPDPATLARPALTPILPIRSAESAPEDKRLRPFQLNGTLYMPNLPARYYSNEPLQIYHQILFPSGFQSVAGEVSVRYIIQNGEVVEQEAVEALPHAGDVLAGNAVDIRKELPLQGMKPGVRQLRAELTQGGKVLVRSNTLSFTVAAEPQPDVWKFAVAVPGPDSPYHATTLAHQMLRQARWTEAARLLESALKQDPELMEPRIALMRLELRNRNYQRVLELGAPAEIKTPGDPQLLWLMGWAGYGLQKYEDCIRFFERLRMEKPDAIEVLNLLADAYYRLDQRDKSLERAKQSLALKPNQGDILQLQERLLNR